MGGGSWAGMGHTQVLRGPGPATGGLGNPGRCGGEGGSTGDRLTSAGVAGPARVIGSWWGEGTRYVTGSVREVTGYRGGQTQDWGTDLQLRYFGLDFFIPRYGGFVYDGDFYIRRLHLTQRIIRVTTSLETVLAYCRCIVAVLSKL